MASGNNTKNIRVEPEQAERFKVIVEALGCRYSIPAFETMLKDTEARLKLSKESPMQLMDRHARELRSCLKEQRKG